MSKCNCSNHYRCWLHRLGCKHAPSLAFCSAYPPLQVEVPGGQQIYVNVNGALGFTQAHSASIPTGAYIGGFFNLTIVSDCSTPRTVISWKSPDGSTGKSRGSGRSAILTGIRRYLGLPDNPFYAQCHGFVSSLRQDPGLQSDSLRWWCPPGRSHGHLSVVSVSIRCLAIRLIQLSGAERG